MRAPSQFWPGLALKLGLFVIAGFGQILNRGGIYVAEGQQDRRKSKSRIRR